jgi:hypothetical protein
MSRIFWTLEDKQDRLEDEQDRLEDKQDFLDSGGRAG